MFKEKSLNMVLDKIENDYLYAPISKNIAKAFEYLRNTDLENIPVGKYEIDESLFAIVQEYDTKNSEECKIETHLKHIDVQYVIAGAEFMGVATLANQPVEVKNEESDYIFYKTTAQPVLVTEGMFTIFFPDDVHQPGIRVEKAAKVKKVVVKIKI